MKQQKGNLRPYERFKAFGPENLSDAELLAITIQTGTRRENALELAVKILYSPDSPVEGLLALKHLSLSQLMAYPGIGEVKAIRIKSLGELARRMAREQTGGEDFSSSRLIAEYYMEDMRHLEREEAFLLCLDTRCKLIRRELLSGGTVDSVLMSPREIFMTALKAGAVRLVLLHNHPSGDPSPSLQDRLVTSRVKECGELMGIELVDHIIIGDLCYYSFAEHGWEVEKGNHWGYDQ